MHNESDYHFLHLVDDGVAFGLMVLPVSVVVCYGLQQPPLLPLPPPSYGRIETVHALHALRIDQVKAVPYTRPRHRKRSRNATEQLLENVA